ncbi:glycosyltransferase family 2 protein [Fundidesulfovibrio soli]|uniref:glycosyltransferase family 2 protein n=1 Tax=Fundidesulfovibrio soli TaxID=2922716 RepID=UPI001FAF9EEC|nr:glycosyltransferase family 2 protein [Fundidesulfovibrio soli]
MTLAAALLFLCLAPLALWLAALGLLALASLRNLRKAGQPPQALHVRLAVLVPAHDEELMIGGTVRAILASAHPTDNLRVFVVADNCTDATAAEARLAGAVCLERDDPQRRGKAYALEFGLAAIRERGGFDAVVLFDADSRPAANFLPRMAGWTSLRREVVQGRYDVLEPERTWFTRLTSMAMTLKNLWQYPGLELLGLSVPLRGTGICLSRGVVERHGWPGRSLTEDLDATIAFVAAGERIHYDPLAVSQQYMPPDMASALVQRRRWSAGESEAKGPLGRLMRQRLAERDCLGAAYALYLAMPPFSLNFAACCGLAVLALPLALAGGPAAPLQAALALSCAHAGYFLLGLSGRRASLADLQALGMIPAYAAWRVWVHVAASFGRVANWDRTPRV